MLIFEVNFKKIKCILYTEVNIFITICNILYMIHSSNSVLRVGVRGLWVYFFLEDLCDIVFGLFDTKIKQLYNYI